MKRNKLLSLVLLVLLLSSLCLPALAEESYFTGIYVKTMPNKTTYTVGDKLDTTGIWVCAHRTLYGDLLLTGSKYSVTYSPTTLNTAGTQKITVKAKLNGKNGPETFTTSFNVTVKEAESYFTGIYVKTMPNKTTYTVGDKLDTSGISVCAHRTVYADLLLGSSYSITYSPTTLNTAGTQKITVKVKLNGKNGAETFSTSFNVTVKEKSSGTPASYYTSLSIYKEPKKLTYVKGETLDTDGLIVRAMHSVHGPLELAPSGYTVSPTSLDKVGTQKITVKAKLLSKSGEKETYTVSFNVTVKEAPVTTKPKVTKHPTGETVVIGGKCSFIARADYDDKITWYCVSADGNTEMKAKDAPKTYVGLKVSGAAEEKLKLSNIPSSLNGCRFFARFDNDIGHANSQKAMVSISNLPEPETTPIVVEITEEPTPVTTLPPTPEATEAPAPAPTEEPTPVPTPAPHTHTYNESVWKADETSHYHECTGCGEKEGAGEPHSYEWTVVKKASKGEAGSKVGKCTVCGFITTAPVLYEGGESGGSSLLLIVLIIIGVLLLAVLVVGILILKKRKQ